MTPSNIIVCMFNTPAFIMYVFNSPAAKRIGGISTSRHFYNNIVYECGYELILLPTRNEKKVQIGIFDHVSGISNKAHNMNIWCCGLWSCGDHLHTANTTFMYNIVFDKATFQCIIHARYNSSRRYSFTKAYVVPKSLPIVYFIIL